MKTDWLKLMGQREVLIVSDAVKPSPGNGLLIRSGCDRILNFNSYSVVGNILQ